MIEDWHLPVSGRRSDGPDHRLERGGVVMVLIRRDPDQFAICRGGPLEACRGGDLAGIDTAARVSLALGLNAQIRVDDPRIGPEIIW
jgi:hypothetical protein